jgi:hypothetical protein
MASEQNLTSQPASGNGSSGGFSKIAAIKELCKQHPRLGLPQANAVIDGTRSRACRGDPSRA